MFSWLSVVAVAMGIGTGLNSVEFKIGQAAPNFRLPGTDGRVHSLSEHRGHRPVVLVWYPALPT